MSEITNICYSHWKVNLLFQLNKAFWVPLITCQIWTPKSNLFNRSTSQHPFIDLQSENIWSGIICENLAEILLVSFSPNVSRTLFHDYLSIYAVIIDGNWSRMSCLKWIRYVTLCFLSVEFLLLCIFFSFIIFWICLLCFNCSHDNGVLNNFLRPFTKHNCLCIHILMSI